MELLMYIFNLALYGSFDNYWTMALIRFKIMRADPTLMVFVMACPDFWTHLMLTPGLPVAAVGEHFARAQQRPLYIWASFRLAQLNAYASRTILASDEHSVVSTRFNVVLSASQRWHSLFVDTDNRSAFLSLRSCLAGFPPPNARPFAIRHFSFTYSYTPDIADAFAPHPLDARDWLDGGYSRLEDLTLRSVNLWWHRLPPFHALRRLSLLHFGRRQHMAHAHFKMIIEGSPCLEFVALKNIGCSDIHPIPLPQRAIRSTSITSMEIDFASEESTGALVAAFVFPSMRTLHLHVHHAADLVLCVPCTGLFSTVLHLTLIADMLSDATYDTLFLSFPTILSIDISRCGPTLFVQFFNVSQGNMAEGKTVVAPHLRSLSALWEKPEFIKDFAILHGARDDSVGAHMELKSIECTLTPCEYGTSPTDLAIRSWIQAHVEHFKMFEAVECVSDSDDDSTSTLSSRS
ncbi:hypothetical protein C8R43DRAFT_1120228 [Mycena crocata]|nr:hypothetical protein C8R43DRAFT_1120228 [Mycena crocata]